MEALLEQKQEELKAQSTLAQLLLYKFEHLNKHHHLSSLQSPRSPC
ncbi:hypothetical protein WN944_001513 [Citrus x changshan-huyou]|uniref:Uncharacterized protein n=1 Tax=Citrus x changshan-huyou TaxID=2935761 RepID=A0AAP0MHA7_9ROSI